MCSKTLAKSTTEKSVSSRSCYLEFIAVLAELDCDLNDFFEVLFADLFEHRVAERFLPAKPVEILLSFAVFIIKLERLGSSQAPVLVELVELVVIFIKENDVGKRLCFAKFSPLEFKGAIGDHVYSTGAGR